MEPIFEYFSIIVNRLQNPLPNGEYGEKHHIYPKSCGGTNDKLNIVKLTPEEHYRCHCLLPYIFEDDADSHRKMVLAWQMMSNRDNGLTPEEYADLKKKAAIANSIAHKGRKVVFSAEHRRKLSEANRKRVLSEESHKKMSESAKRRPCSRKGVHLSEETKRKLRESVSAYWAKRKAAKDLQS